MASVANGFAVFSQEVLEVVEQVLRQAKGAAAFAEFIRLSQQLAQGVGADALLCGDFLLEFAQPVSFRSLIMGHSPLAALA